MPPTNRVDQIIRSFSLELQAVLREQLSEEITAAIQAALGAGASRRGAGKASKGKDAAPARGRASKGGKRTPEEIEKLAIQLLSYIDKNPEQRSEQIAAATKLTTGELVLPLKRLLADKKIKAKGKARGTTYTAVK